MIHTTYKYIECTSASSALLHSLMQSDCILHLYINLKTTKHLRLPLLSELIPQEFSLWTKCHLESEKTQSLSKSLIFYSEVGSGTSWAGLDAIKGAKSGLQKWYPLSATFLALVLIRR